MSTWSRALSRRCAPALLALALVVTSPIRPLSAAGTTIQPAQRPQPAQEEFVPIDQLPPDEQLPAAPLLVAAYAFVWVALVLYVWSVWRRISRVERELADIGRRTAAKGR